MRHALCHQLFQVRRHTLLWQERNRPKGADAYTEVFLKLVSCAFHFNILPGGNIHVRQHPCTPENMPRNVPPCTRLPPIHKLV